MPLKKPKEIPKIPKSRKKSIEDLKDSVPAKKKDEIEYICKAFFKYDKIQRKQFCILLLTTVKEFTVLNYEISVNVQKKKNNIDISILGLNTKHTYVTYVKPAVSELFFEDLFGKQTVNIIKQDGSINSAIFEFNIFKKEILLHEELIPKKKNNRKFCSFEVDIINSTFSE